MAQLLYRAEAVKGESMYGYIHRLAFYNGFKYVAHFVNHLTKEQRPYIPVQELLGSLDILKALCSATTNENCKNLVVDHRPYFKAGNNGFTLLPKLCPQCFRDQAVLKHKWFQNNRIMCHVHGEPLISLDWVKSKRAYTINWQFLATICESKTQKSSSSSLENIALFNKTYSPKVNLRFKPYFEQRLSKITASAMLSPKQKTQLRRFAECPNKKDFQRIIDVLKESLYVSNSRAYQLTYWGIVDWLLEIERVGLSDTWRNTKFAIEYCKYQFINDFPPSTTSKLYCDIRYPRAFHEFDVFSPVFSAPWLKNMKKSEIASFLAV